MALFFSYCIVLESRLLGLLHTLSIYIKINNNGLWKTDLDFKKVETKLVSHWETIRPNVDKQLKTFDNTEVNKIKNPFSLKGIGEGVLLNGVQINENKRPKLVCGCPETGVHNVSLTVNTPSDLKTFEQFSTCSGDVYGCKSGEKDYTFCFPQDINKQDFVRYEVIQVGSDADAKFYGNTEMPEASECSPTEHVKGSINSSCVCELYIVLFPAKSECLFCQCKCFDSQNLSKLRNAFSLGEVLSDVSKNG